MDQQDWLTLLQDTSVAMRAYVQAFACPIAKLNRDGGANLIGTGSYLDVEGRQMLLMTDTMAAGAKPDGLAFRFPGRSTYTRIIKPLVGLAPKSGLTVTPIEDSLWNSEHEGTAIPLEKICDAHDPVRRELFFISGFVVQSDYDVPVLNWLEAPPAHFITQEKDRQSAGEAQQHFVLRFVPELAKSEFEQPVGVFGHPSGFIGSIVWNTFRLDHLNAGIAWTPDAAKASGVVLRWVPGDDSLLAIRIEHLKEGLDEMISRNSRKVRS